MTIMHCFHSVWTKNKQTKHIFHLLSSVTRPLALLCFTLQKMFVFFALTHKFLSRFFLSLEFKSLPDVSAICSCCHNDRRLVLQTLVVVCQLADVQWLRTGRSCCFGGPATWVTSKPLRDMFRLAYNLLYNLIRKVFSLHSQMTAINHILRFIEKALCLLLKSLLCECSHTFRKNLLEGTRLNELESSGVLCDVGNLNWIRYLQKKIMDKMSLECFKNSVENVRIFYCIVTLKPFKNMSMPPEI